MTEVRKPGAPVPEYEKEGSAAKKPDDKTGEHDNKHKDGTPGPGATPTHPSKPTR